MQRNCNKGSKDLGAKGPRKGRASEVLRGGAKGLHQGATVRDCAKGRHYAQGGGVGGDKGQGRESREG